MSTTPHATAPGLPELPDAKAALGWMHTARFLTTAAQLHHLPEITVPEIAFVGRSNAGKSTCINTLTQQRQLAFASKKPGRTQHINLFALGRQGVEAGLKFLVLLTKADKLTRAEQAKALSITRLQAGGGEVRMFSALKRQGVDEVAQLLWQWAHPAVEPAAAPDSEPDSEPV
jgi:GTP-binding protein EngB required for normal cell division